MADDFRHSSEVLTTENLLPSNYITIRGRDFTRTELRIIQRTVSEQYKSGRTNISRVVCEELNWRQPNGWLKDRACRDVLRQLEVLGLVTLPPPLVAKRAPCIVRQPRPVRPFWEISNRLEQLSDKLQLEFAKGNKSEQLWNQLVSRFHYLGHKIAVGRCIKYVVMAGGQPIGAISFSSPAWRLASRDALLPQVGIDKNSIHDLTINNSRFLILPNVSVPNLASRILSLATKQVAIDWEEYYSVVPLVVETFVDTQKYMGTCYKAANWIEIGRTKGYAKKGASYQNGQTSKQVLLYGLNRSIRRRLLTIWGAE